MARAVPLASGNRARTLRRVQGGSQEGGPPFQKEGWGAQESGAPYRTGTGWGRHWTSGVRSQRAQGLGGQSWRGPEGAGVKAFLVPGPCPFALLIVCLVSKLPRCNWIICVAGERWL